MSQDNQITSPPHILSQTPPFLTTSPRYIPNPFIQDTSNFNLELSQIKNKLAQKEFELVSSQTEQKRLLLKVDFLEQKIVATIQDYEKRIEQLEKSKRFLMESESSLKSKVKELESKCNIERIEYVESVAEPKITRIICDHTDENKDLIEKLYKEIENMKKSLQSSQQEKREAIDALEKLKIKYKTLECSIEESKSDKIMFDCFKEKLNSIPIIEKEKEHIYNEYQLLKSEYEALKNKCSRVEYDIPNQSNPEYEVMKEKIDNLQSILEKYQCSSLYEFVLKWNELEARLISILEESQDVKGNLLEVKLQKKDMENELSSLRNDHQSLIEKYEKLCFDYSVMEKRNKMLLSDVNTCQNILMQKSSMEGSSLLEPINERLNEWRGI